LYFHAPGLEDVLHDPQPLFGLDLEHLQLVAVADLHEGEVVGSDVHRGRCFRSCLDGGHGFSSVLIDSTGLTARLDGPASFDRLT
jgi:hypothetical protein